MITCLVLGKGQNAFANALDSALTIKYVKNAVMQRTFS